METFVDAERFTGTCYQAANWELLGVTQGRGRRDAKHQSARPVKKVWVYPLHSEARERLRGVRLRRPSLLQALGGAEIWRGGVGR